jgi:hypothetical protein
MRGETENASDQARDAQESGHDGATQGSPSEIENAFNQAGEAQTWFVDRVRARQRLTEGRIRTRSNTQRTARSL